MGGADVLARPAAIAGALAERRAPGVPDGRRVRDRQPAHQPRRRRDEHDCAGRPGRAYVVALGRIVAILDLIPLAGATLAAIIVTTVAFIHSRATGSSSWCSSWRTSSLENHVLQPLVYGRTVQLSPLLVLVSVLLGAELAGVLGVLGVIPIAGTIQVVLVDWLRHRRGPSVPEPFADAPSAPGPG